MMVEIVILCTVDDNALVGDGTCHGGDYNSQGCSYDGGDSKEYNGKYPQCSATNPHKVGDGECDEEYNTKECKYDGGDCI
jgi:hypothetical protein